MIHPTGRTVLLAAAAIPASIAIVLLSPDSWPVGLFYVVALIGGCAVDLGLSARLAAFRPVVQTPAQIYIGRGGDIEIALTGPWQEKARRIDIAVDSGGVLNPVGWDWAWCAPGDNRITIPITAQRRGNGIVQRLWLRWHGPFGLMAKSARLTLDRSVAVLPDIRAIQDAALLLNSRDATFGMKPQFQQGEGSEFDALRDYVPGLDHRAIDWKHSARHRSLVCKEFRTERNHQIVLAFDSGQLMSQPLQGLPRLDRAINAGLMLAYTSLRAGDRVGVLGFDAQVRVSMEPISGPDSFPHIQRVCSAIDYCHEETNFTLGLSGLLGDLKRRSMIVLITEFVDTVTAELMLDSIARLSARHLVVFVSLQEPELHELADAEPRTFQSMAGAVVAHDMLQERRVVHERLRRLGVHCLDVRAERLNASIVNEYIAIKQRELI